MFLFLVSHAAYAACTATPTAPADGATAIQSPAFTWSGDCTRYRLQFSPSGSFGSDVLSTTFRTSRAYAFDEDAWDTNQASWGASVYWRIEGLDSTAATFDFGARILLLDPNADDDAYSVAQGDCNDADAAIHPDVVETCNGIDDDCDGIVDDGLIVTWYADADGDLYGDFADAVTTCAGAPAGYLSDATDCDDLDAEVNPGMVEVCGDGIDQNCNGMSDGCSFEGNVDVATSDVLIRGTRGYQIVPATTTGDVNGDGVDDLLVRAMYRPTGRNRGSVYGWFGPLDGSERLTNADFRFDGDTDQSYFGVTVALAGDVNGDGEDDLLIGSQLDSTAKGKVFLYPGPVTAGAHRTSEAIATFSGYTSGDGSILGKGLGDLNGDGYGDFAIGTQAYDESGFVTDGGWVDIWYGPITGSWTVGEGDVVYYGDSSSRAGYTVDSGDIDGDGSTDLVIASAGENARADTLEGGNSSGSVRICYGPDLWGGLISLECTEGVVGNHANASIGNSTWQAVHVADINDDGLDDLLIPSTVDAYGTLFGCFGPIDSLKASTSCEFILQGSSTTSSDLGYSSGWGDLNGDGATDLAVADPYGKNPAAIGGAGTISIVYGPIVAGTMSVTAADATLYGAVGNGYAGSFVNIHDYNGDGQGDVCLGTPGADTNGNDAGEVRVLFGGDL